MTQQRPLGWIPDPYDHRDWTAKDHLYGAPHVTSPAGVSLLTGSPSLKHVRGPRIEQVGSSCVGFSLKRAVYMSHRLQGVEKPAFASGLGNYTIARRRAVKNRRPLPPLQDVGSSPLHCMNGLQGIGIVPESAWSDTVDHLNLPLTPHAIQAAFDQSGTALQWMRVTGAGSERLGAVDEGLRKGWVPMYAIHVDQPYCDHMGSGVIRSIDPKGVVGGHYQVVLEIEGDGTVLVDNWWGSFWGFDDGMGRLHPDLFGSGYVSDVILVKSVPAWV